MSKNNAIEFKRSSGTDGMFQQQSYLFVLSHRPVEAVAVLSLWLQVPQKILPLF